ncbi:carbohydrate kinase [Candidatus Bipolaricaulota bacterium]|nr:carbohydrate kinase [Candidatus Bipolaricaulota bacterium]
MKVLVTGEGIIDFFPLNECKAVKFLARPGGSPLNVAVGLSRLGVETGFLGKFSRDYFGKFLVTYLLENGVDVRFITRGDEPTALAFVQLEEGNPRFSFYLHGTATIKLTIEELPKRLPNSIAALHFGSLAMVQEPCATALARLMERESPMRLISFDPNIRPECITDASSYRLKFIQLLTMIDLLKLSQEDLSYIAPKETKEAVIEKWLAQGPKLIVVTLGPAGARAYTRYTVIEVKAQPVKVVDTVGAGDAFTAGLLAALSQLRRLDKKAIEKISQDELHRALNFAARVAALTCTRVGADPPRISEIGEI